MRFTGETWRRDSAGFQWRSTLRRIADTTRTTSG